MYSMTKAGWFSWLVKLLYSQILRTINIPFDKKTVVRDDCYKF